MTESTVVLNADEKAELQLLVDRELADLHGEIRRTDSREYREDLRREESLLRRLIMKLREPAELVENADEIAAS